MLLKKIEMFGFKSFNEKTLVHFQPGITAVVGPNGCGKSNIADAILWVLGEQSAKTLRGEKMEDVIFNGTDSRKPLGLAEVNLTLGNIATGQLSGEFGEYREITITRRLYRSGESDYLINKVPCRLKDIRDLLIDTGAGAKGHTIIEQGKVDEILNASPARRREIIEETAGISKYKIRRNEALRKLDSTGQNLLRVRDILGEVKKQMNSLDRQARKAEKYQLLSREMKDLELSLKVAEGKIQEAALRELIREFEESETALIGLETRRLQAEEKTEALQTRKIEKESELNSFVRDISDLESTISRHEARVALLESQLLEWETQVRQSGEEKERYRLSMEETGRRIADVHGGLDSVKILLAEKEGLLREKEEEERAISTRAKEQQEEFDQANQELTRLITGMGDQTARLATQDSRKEEIQKRVEKEALEWTETHQACLGVRKEEEELILRLTETEKTVLSKKEALDLLEAEFRETQEELRNVSDLLGRKKEQVHGVRARLDSLNELQKNRAGYWEGVKSLLKGRETGEITRNLPGSLADFIEVEPRFEKAIESALNEKLQGILVDSPADSVELIRYLKESSSGKAIFVLKDPPMGASSSWIEEAGEEEGVFGPARKRLSVLQEYDKAVAGLLSDVIIVRDIETALRRWEIRPGSFTYVTLDGEVVDGRGTVWSGAKENGSEGILQRQREIKELHAESDRLVAEAGSLEAALLGLSEKSNHLDSARKSLHETIQQLKIEIATQSNQGQKFRQDFERLSQREAHLQNEMDRGVETLGQIENETRALQEAISLSRENRGRLEARLLDLKRMLQESMDERNRLGSHLTEIKIETASLTGKVHHLQSNLLELENGIREFSEKILEKETFLVGLEEKRKGALDEKERLLGAIHASMESLVRLKEGKSLLIEAHDEIAASLRNQEEEARLLRREIDGAVAKKSDLQARLASDKVRFEHLDQFLRTYYEISYEEVSTRESAELDLETARVTLEELKGKLDQIGPVNLTAIDEFKELEERFNFLSAQEKDLTQAIESLQETISKINKTTKTLFSETFASLNRKFGEVFVSFFEGGKAEMVLLDEGNPFESGVDIIVQPPGKRVRNVSMLSGGEKALTAIALLFASFLIHPSPFCILDEIDAPLDEENIRRFTTVLRRMVDHSQFIVITHNKRTMEIADILYGVTQEEPGISKLISVRMAQGDIPEPLQPVTS